MKTRADIINELEDEFGIKASELSRRELLIIGIATNDIDNEVKKCGVIKLVCPNCRSSSYSETNNERRCKICHKVF